MLLLFDIAALVAVTATLLAVTRTHALVALIYVVVSLLAVAFIFLLLGAFFVAALEVTLFAGAIMVLFLFVATILALGHNSVAPEPVLLAPKAWLGPALLATVLLAELGLVISRGAPLRASIGGGSAKELALALFGPYLIATEIASLLLLAGLVGAVRLGRGVGAPAEKSARALELPEIPGMSKGAPWT
jgi:NADH-quinone oxidoreductase subunit J